MHKKRAKGSICCNNQDDEVRRLVRKATSYSTCTVNGNNLFSYIYVAGIQFTQAISS